MIIDPQVLVQLEAAVTRCGVPLAEVQISYEDYLQSEEIRVLSSKLSDDQISCLLKTASAAPFPIVSFQDEHVRTREFELSRADAKNKARDWLNKRGMLAELPTFDTSRESPLGFARRIETFCGIKPGDALEINEQLGIVTPRMEWVGRPLQRGWLWRKLNADRHNQQFECLLNVIAASNAESQGIKFGFVGNEYVIDDKQR